MTLAPADKLPSVDSITREINFTSVSALQKFDRNEYGGCERRWWFRYVERLPEEKTPQQEVGVLGHSQIEHYLPTGEDVLGPVARAGIGLLPPPGPDILVEWGLNDQKKPKSVLGDDRPFYTPGESLLRADGVPLIGFMDWFHARGDYVSPEKSLLKDPPNTVEIGDNKFNSSFGYTKTADELPDTTQMSGYGDFARVKVPNLEFVRLSHVVFQTRGAHDARKTTVLVPLEKIARAWEKRGHAVARKMRDIATIRREADVPANTESCRSFGRPCSFRQFCSAFLQQRPIDILKKSSFLKSTPNQEANKMSALQDKVRAMSGVPAVPSPGGTPINGATPWIPQAAAPAPALPPAPAAALTAKDAVNGATYRFSTGAEGMFLSAQDVGGGQVGYSFLLVTNGVAGGQPFQVAATEPVVLTKAAATPAPPPQRKLTPIPPLPEVEASAPVQAPTAPAPAGPPLPTLPAKRGRRTKEEIAAANAAANTTAAADRDQQVFAAISTAREMFKAQFGVDGSPEQVQAIWQALLG